MPKIQWTNLPPALRQHLFDRLEQRKITAEDLYKLKLWPDSLALAPILPDKTLHSRYAQKAPRLLTATREPQQRDILRSSGPCGGTKRKWRPRCEGRTARRAIVGLKISIRASGDVTILDLQGKATIGVDSDLLSGHLQMLTASGVRKLLLNLADLTQVDSSGISAITGTYVSLTRDGGSLKLLRPCGRARAVLRAIHLLDIIPTFDDEAQALASFRPQGYSAKP